jgi:hypothetical protein
MNIKRVEITEAKPAPASAPTPMGPTPSGKTAHDATVNAAEGQRQTATAAAGNNQSAVRNADITFHRAFVQSALANGVSPSSSIRALQSLGVTGL